MKKYDYTIYLKSWLGNSKRIISFDSLRFCKKIFIPHLFIPFGTILIYVVKSPKDHSSKIKSKVVYKKTVKHEWFYDIQSCSVSDLRLMLSEIKNND